MEVGSPEWIEASLARLDDLERQRGDHEAALEDASDPAQLKRHTEALERLDVEIKSLYAQLESVAGDDEAGDEDEPAEDEEEGAPVPTQGDDELSAPHFKPAAAAKAAPVAAAADNPFGSPPSDFGGGGGGFEATPAPMGDDDIKVGGSGKWVFLALVVLAGIGVGGFFVWQNMQAKKADVPAGPTEPPVVIKAAGVPDDTEAPPTVPGGTATISPTANIDPGDTGKKKKVEEKKAKPIKLKTDGGPL
jgi:hypothetical protein